MPSRASKTGKKRDFTQIAKSIIDQATGNVPTEPPDKRNPHAVALSKLGASKGGKAQYDLAIQAWHDFQFELKQLALRRRQARR